MNILIAGVGGQGAVLASKIIAQCAVLRGESARTAETIGMAQRGGSVVSHVRTGDGAYSPLIPKGTADVLLAFEPSEAVRSLAWLRPGGLVVTADRGIYPASGAEYHPEKMLEFLRSQEQIGELVIISAAKVYEGLGSYRSLNIALLGASAGTGKLGVTATELEAAMDSLMSAKNAKAAKPALNIFA